MTRRPAVDSFGAPILAAVKARRPSANLLDMLGDDLRTTVSGILNRVRRDTESVRFPSVPMPGHTSRFSLIAEPLRDSHGSLTHILISLVDAHARTAAALVPRHRRPHHRHLPRRETPQRRVGRHVNRFMAEEELSYTKEHLSRPAEHEAPR